MTEEQMRYNQWLANPPKFYCRSLANCEEPMSYCDHQCFECMAVVGETRLKNKAMATVKREGNTVYIQHLDHMRKVGEILQATAGEEIESDVLLVERDREKHMMMVWQAYGFAKEVMDHKDWFGFVQIEETDHGQRNTYLIPREDLVLHGREYQTDGFEKQYFVTVEKLQKYKL